MGIVKFIFSRDFIKHLAIILVVLVAILYGVLLSLKFYTQHGKTVAVPDLAGLNETEVEHVCAKLSLRFSISDSVYLADAVAGTVLEQHPAAGYRVKEDRIIYLIVVSGTPDQVRVPNVTDVSYREAINRLQNAGLKLGLVEYRPSEFANLVLEQLYLGMRITHDTLLAKGSAVDLVVGRGAVHERSEIPDLWGYSINEARKKLYSLNFDMGALVFDDSFIENPDTTGARIYKQNPKPIAGKMVNQGAMVDVWVSKFEHIFEQDTTLQSIEFDEAGNDTEF